MDQFWLLLGFSEQLGTLNRFVVAEILVIGGGFYSRLNSKLGMIIPVVEKEAPVIDDLILRLWYVFVFYEFWWLRNWLRNWFQGFCLGSHMRSSWMLILKNCGEGARAKVFSRSHGQTQRVSFDTIDAFYCFIRWSRQADSQLYATVLEKGLSQYEENLMINQRRIVGRTWNMITKIILLWLERFSTDYIQNPTSGNLSFPSKLPSPALLATRSRPSDFHRLRTFLGEHPSI
ncbi:hypothetical protein YC2023_084740 [Brassica napus]